MVTRRTMDQQAQYTRTEVDLSLVTWFLSLSPDQRLAELESRVAFFNEMKSIHDAQLSGNPAGS